MEVKRRREKVAEGFGSDGKDKLKETEIEGRDDRGKGE